MKILCELNTLKKQIQKDIKIKQNNQGKKGYLLYLFAKNLRQSRAFRVQFIFSGWGFAPIPPAGALPLHPMRGALRRPPRPPACFRYFRHQPKLSLRFKCFMNFNEFSMYLFRRKRGGGGCTDACICMGTHSQPLLQYRLMDVYETW